MQYFSILLRTDFLYLFLSSFFCIRYLLNDDAVLSKRFLYSYFNYFDMPLRFFFSGFLFCCTTTVFSQANTKLSNLASPTAANQSLLPSSSNSKDLGSSSLNWRSFYLKGGMWKGNQRFLSNSGLGNTFLGLQTGVLTMGTNNTAVGDSALYLSYYGNNNTAVGYKAMSQNVGGSNTAVGYEAMINNTTGVANTAVGNSAMLANTTGGSNTALGSNALQHNSTGNFNIAIGQSTLYNNIGNFNTSVGYNTMAFNTTGAYNTSLGGFALNYTTTAQYNTAVGYRAGSKYDNGYNNVFVGANTDVNGAGYYNLVAIGQQTECTASSQARIGNAATNSIGGYANWSNISDGRYKKNLKENVPGLAFIDKLRPVTYNLDASELDAFLNKDRTKENAMSNEAKAVMDKALKEKEALVQTGFVAQEVERVAKELHYDFSGVDAPRNSKDLYGLRYSDFVVPLVKAVQELDSESKAKDQKIGNLENRIAKLEEAMNKLIALNNNTQTSTSALKQNTPNPVTNSTAIAYSLPVSTHSAQLLITDAAGKTIKAISLHASGTVDVNAATWSSGMYNYTLLVDNNIVDTKKMIIAH